MPTKELEDIAKKACYSFDTLKRAKNELKKDGRIKYLSTGSNKEKVWYIQRVNETEFAELSGNEPTPWDEQVAIPVRDTEMH